MFRYQPEHFAGLRKENFLKALSAEGIPLTSGYSPLNERHYLKNALRSRAYQRIYSAAELAALEEHNRCPVNDQLCREAVWVFQSILLGTRSDMENIAAAILKIQKYAAELARL